MIRLRRIRSEDVIHHNFYGKRKEAFEKELLLNERSIKRGEIQKHCTAIRNLDHYLKQDCDITTI